MWLARNKDGRIKLFELPPRRFHSGPELLPEDIGFNDEVSVGNGKDIYSFWAIQTQYNSNELQKDSYGINLFKSVGKGKYNSYDVFQNLKWEDEPIEVELKEE